MRSWRLLGLALMLGCGDKEDTDTAVTGDDEADTDTDTDADTDTDTDADADTDTDTDTDAEYGPSNDWWHARVSDVPTDMAGTGWREGDVAYNFTLSDQNGDEVELYQFYGKVVVLDVYAEW
jgi:hypothetical protein